MQKTIVVIPTYNEIENIDAIINAVLSLPLPFHILIIDDNSPDGTSDLVRQLQLKHTERLFLITRQGKLGLGTAYIAGFKWAIEKGYIYICEMDADFSHDPNDLVRLYNAAESGADLVIGSRYKSGVNVVNWPMGRVLMSYFASIYVRLVTGMKIYDTTAGFKCYRNNVLKAIDLDSIRAKGYVFQIEMKFITWKLGFRIEEIPIIFTDRKKGASKMSGGIFSEALGGVIVLKLRSFVKKYTRK